MGLGYKVPIGAPIGVVPDSYVPTNCAGNILAATADMLACRFYPETNQVIDAVDIWLHKVGAPTGISCTLEIQTDNGSGSPSGAYPGGGGTNATASTAAPAADGWLGGGSAPILLGLTASLTANTPYWLVLKVSAGTISSNANSYQPKHLGTGVTTFIRGKLMLNTAGVWGTPVIASPMMIRRTQTTNVIDGSAFTGVGAQGNSGLTTIFNDGTTDHRQAVSFKFGANVTAQGAAIKLRKNGTPTSLTLDIYQGSALKYSSPVIAQGDIVSDDWLLVQFTSPVSLPGGTTIYLVVRSAATGSSANSYDIRTYPITAVYQSAVGAPDFRILSGTGTDPTTYTPSTVLVPVAALLLNDPAVDTSATGGGGTTLIFCGTD